MKLKGNLNNIEKPGFPPKHPLWARLGWYMYVDGSVGSYWSVVLYPNAGAGAGSILDQGGGTRRDISRSVACLRAAAPPPRPCDRSVADGTMILPPSST